MSVTPTALFLLFNYSSVVKGHTPKRVLSLDEGHNMPMLLLTDRQLEEYRRLRQTTEERVYDLPSADRRSCGAEPVELKIVGYDEYPEYETTIPNIE